MLQECIASMFLLTCVLWCAAALKPEPPKFDAVAFEQTAGLRPPGDNLTDVERRQQVLPELVPAHCCKDVLPGDISTGVMWRASEGIGEYCP